MAATGKCLSLFLVRHCDRYDFQVGEERWRAVAQRPHDTPLSDAGRRQAQDVGRAVKAAGGAVRVLSSPFLRCVETADRIAAALGREVLLEPALWEIIWTASHVAEPAERACYFPRVSTTHAPVLVPAPDEVFPEGALRRFAAASELLTERFGNDTLCLVTHAAGVVGIAAALLQWRVRDVPPAPAGGVWHLRRETPDSPWGFAPLGELADEGAAAHLSVASTTKPWPLRQGGYDEAGGVMLAAGDTPPWALRPPRGAWTPPASGTRLRVLTWNILAHIHTHWNREQHGAAAKENETEAQRAFRYARISSALRRIRPDVALLQEVDSYFIPWQQQGGACELRELPGYSCHQSYSDRGEGTVVLLRRAAFECRHFTAVPSTKAHGWKTAAVAEAVHRSSGTALRLVSVHLPWGKPAEQAELLQSVAAAAARMKGPMVLAGDFNTEEEQLGQGAQMLSGMGLRRLPTPEEQPTEMCSRNVIDLVWASQELLAPARSCPAPGAGPPVPEVGPLSLQRPRGPWAPEEDNDGSDHAWVLADFPFP